MDEKEKAELKDFVEKTVREILDRKTDSISVSKTSTGKYSWDVKIYTDDLLDEEKCRQVIEKIRGIHTTLAEKFKGE
ncbi:MAG: hypothetical protein WC350_06130 [Candidatus Micrarchaeia archaeon]|jgi:hypothetical protein